MADLIDYLMWRGDLSFNEDKFNEVDNLIFSVLSYADFSKVVPKFHTGRPCPLPDAVCFYEKYCANPNYLGAVVPEKTPELIHRVPLTKRFSEVKVCAFVNEIDEDRSKQFCAVTFLLPDKTAFVSYRGTDDTIVGWREDFMLSYSLPTKSQIRAVEFLEDAASAMRGGIRIGGHSKGGNLAFYASVFCRRDVQERIISSYCNDGPGFGMSVLQKDEYKRISEKLISIVPQSSFIGLLLEHPDNYQAVSSDAPPLFQHDPFTWNVLGNSFVHLDRLSYKGTCHELTLKKWLDSICEDDRKKFTDIFFRILEDTGAETLTDLTNSKLKSGISILKAASDLSSDEKEHMLKLIMLLIGMSRESNKKLSGRK